MAWEACHSRRGMRGVGMAASWGREAPRAGEASRDGFFVGKSARVLDARWGGVSAF